MVNFLKFQTVVACHKCRDKQGGPSTDQTASEEAV